jgi:hypothetical protein
MATIKQGKDLQVGDKLKTDEGAIVTIKRLSPTSDSDIREADFSDGDWGKLDNRAQYEVVVE